MKQKKNNPPSFSELLLLLRTDEDRQTAKSNRMKQHLGFSKTKVQSNPLSVNDCTPDNTDMAALSNNPAQSPAKPNKKTKPTPRTPAEPESSPPGESTPERKPPPGYCFKCGQDGHIVPSCSNEPNPEQVELKRKEFRQKQQAWEQQN